MRDWKTLFVAGKSLELNETDEEREEERNSISVSSLTPSTEVKWKSSSQVLDCTDMREYQVMWLASRTRSRIWERGAAHTENINVASLQASNDARQPHQAHYLPVMVT